MNLEREQLTDFQGTVAAWVRRYPWVFAISGFVSGVCSFLLVERHSGLRLHPGDADARELGLAGIREMVREQAAKPIRCAEVLICGPVYDPASASGNTIFRHSVFLHSHRLGIGSGGFHYPLDADRTDFHRRSLVLRVAGAQQVALPVVSWIHVVRHVTNGSSADTQVALAPRRMPGRWQLPYSFRCRVSCGQYRAIGSPVPVALSLACLSRPFSAGRPGYGYRRRDSGSPRLRLAPGWTGQDSSRRRGRPLLTRASYMRAFLHSPQYTRPLDSTKRSTTCGITMGARSIEFPWKCTGGVNRATGRGPSRRTFPLSMRETGRYTS